MKEDSLGTKLMNTVLFSIHRCMLGNASFMFIHLKR